MKEQQFQFNNQFIGKIVKILIEKVGKRDVSWLAEPSFTISFFEDIRKVYKIGEFADIKINSVKVNNLSGELIETVKSKQSLTVNRVSNSCMNIVINDSSKLVNIFGKNDENLRLIEKEVSVEIIPHGNTIQISGDKSNLNIAESIILDMVERDNLGVNNNIDEVSGSIRVKNIKSDQKKSEKNIIKTKIKTILPRSLNQDEYINSIYNNPLTFGIGPAGTGKTYLAVAAAAYFLEAGLVDRIILSRPAVEAGEKLGFTWRLKRKNRSLPTSTI